MRRLMVACALRRRAFATLFLFAVPAYTCLPVRASAARMVSWKLPGSVMSVLHVVSVEQDGLVRIQVMRVSLLEHIVRGQHLRVLVHPLVELLLGPNLRCLPHCDPPCLEVTVSELESLEPSVSPQPSNVVSVVNVET